MLFDANQCDDKCLGDAVFDACIIGSGPAGMSLALKLAEKGWKIGLFEGGGLEFSKESQQIYSGKNIGIDYFPLDVTRLRYLGGSSNHWEGWCLQLEDLDFLTLPQDNDDGWPIRKSNLDPYAAPASDILDIKPIEETHDIFSGGGGPFVPFQFRHSRPTRFNAKYKGTLAASKNIHLFVNANLVDLDLSDNLQQVSQAIFRSFARLEPFTVKAKYFAVCLGGLENPRFLLNANRQVKVGIGNENDLVGRFFCEHLHYHVGEMFLDVEAQQRYPQNRSFLRPKRNFIVDERIGNFCLMLERLVHKPDSTLSDTLRDGVCESGMLRRIVEAIRRKDFYCFDAVVRCVAEQHLNPDSRVKLGNDTDRFGKRRLELDWHILEIDKRTMQVGAIELGKQMAQTNVGRLKVPDWLLDPSVTVPTTAKDEVAGNHHMCTTRMSDDPKKGVVDRNCRVHSLDNLYIGGSSVFGSSGFCNPTFTIVQLALRLADHLDSRLKSAA